LEYNRKKNSQKHLAAIQSTLAKAVVHAKYLWIA
jgi:hypothetical protein